MKEEGNCTRSRYSDPHHEFAGKNVLYRKHARDIQAVWNTLKSDKSVKFENVDSLEDLEGIIASGRRKLFEARCKRPRPHLDDKIICGWNGLVLSAFAMAHKVLVLGSGTGSGSESGSDSMSYLETAVGIANFMYNNMRDSESGYLYRIHGKEDIFGFAADYSFMIRGLLDLFEASFDPKWLKWSVELQDIQNALFFDEKLGSYFETVEGAENVIMRLKEEYDGAEPCAASVAVGNLLKLYHFTKKESYLETFCGKTFGYLKGALDERAFAIPLSVIALDEYENGMKQVVISTVNNPQSDGDVLVDGDDEKDTLQNQEQMGQFLKVLYGDFHPDTVGVVLNEQNVQSMKEDVDAMYGYYYGDEENKAMVYVCRDFACQAPTANAMEFASQLQGDNGNE